MKVAKRARQEPPADSRSVIVRSDRARSHIADLAIFLDSVISDRDEALAKIDELNENVTELTTETERIAALENDVAYWKNNRDELKLASDGFEMDLRRANGKIAESASSAQKAGAEAESLRQILKTKDAELVRVAEESLKIRHDFNCLRIEMRAQESNLADMNRCVQEKNASSQAMLETLNESRTENEKLKAEYEKLKVDYDKSKTDLLNSNQELEGLKVDLLESERSCEALERDLDQHDAKLDAEKLETAKCKRETEKHSATMKRIAELYTDAYQASPDGTGHLLGSGKMLSTKSIVRGWMGDSGFNGDPSYHIKCIETNTFTTIVRSPAVTRFIRNVAEIASIESSPEFHFKFSVRPTTDGQPIRWTTYNSYDQLTLIAKLIYLVKINTENSSFQAMVMENHVITATCSKNMTNGWVLSALLQYFFVLSLSCFQHCLHHLRSQRHHQDRPRRSASPPIHPQHRG